MAAHPLEFWFEFASTYSYIAAMRIEGACGAAGVPLVWRPFSLGPIFALQGWNDSHYNLNDRRGSYMWRDMERLTAKLGLPWQKPAVFPRNTTGALRVACSISSEPWIGDFVRAVFIANFGENRDIGETAVLGEILTHLGQDPAAVITRASDFEHRPMLRHNTEEATARGIFGAPNCFVGNELFWGEEAVDDAIAWARHSVTG